MTQIVLLSDIHGNLHALEAVATALPAGVPVIAAGDLCLEGPKPAEVLDLLEELGWALIMGNTDRDTVHPPADEKAEKARLTAWTRQRLGERRLQKLSELPFSVRREIEGDRLLVVHANPLTMDQHLYPTMSVEELQPYLSAAEADILAFGHLHTPYVRPVKGTLLIDVSSVGHPKDLDLRAAYTILEWTEGSRSVRQVRVPYDVEETVSEMRRCGMPDAERYVEDLLKASY